MSSLLINRAKTLFTTSLSLKWAFCFVLPTMGNREMVMVKQWLAKYGLFIQINSTNGPHCLEEFDFLPFSGHAVSLSGARLQRAGPLSTVLRVWNWVLLQIKPWERTTERNLGWEMKKRRKKEEEKVLRGNCRPQLPPLPDTPTCHMHLLICTVWRYRTVRPLGEALTCCNFHLQRFIASPGSWKFLPALHPEMVSSVSMMSRMTNLCFESADRFSTVPVSTASLSERQLWTCRSDSHLHPCLSQRYCYHGSHFIQIRTVVFFAHTGFSNTTRCN